MSAGCPVPRVTMWYRANNVAGSILRQGKDHAWRCNAAERMRSERDQRRLRLGGQRAGHEDRLAQRFAQPTDRLDFTAIGPAVNLVSRLEGLCKPLRKTVLVSGALAAETQTPLIALGTHALRGITSPCVVFTLPEN